MGQTRWTRTRLRQEQGDWQETAPAHRTVELVVVIVVALGLLATAALDHAFSAFQLWTLLTALAIGYLLSRGLARSGVPWRRDTTTTDYQSPAADRRPADDRDARVVRVSATEAGGDAGGAAEPPA